MESKDYSLPLTPSHQYAIYRGLQCMPNPSRLEEYLAYVAETSRGDETQDTISSKDIQVCFLHKPHSYQCLKTLIEKKQRPIFEKPASDIEGSAMRVCRTVVRLAENDIRGPYEGEFFSGDWKGRIKNRSTLNDAEREALNSLVDFYSGKVEEKRVEAKREVEKEEKREKYCSFYIPGETCGGFNLASKISLGATYLKLFSKNAGEFKKYFDYRFHAGYRHFKQPFQGWAYEGGANIQVGAGLASGDSQDHYFMDYYASGQAEYHFGSSTITSDRGHAVAYFGGELGYRRWGGSELLPDDSFFGGTYGGIGWFAGNFSLAGAQTQVRGGTGKWLESSVILYVDPLSMLGLAISAFADPDTRIEDF